MKPPPTPCAGVTEMVRAQPPKRPGFKPPPQGIPVPPWKPAATPVPTSSPAGVKTPFKGPPKGHPDYQEV
eukprot:5035476-Amphidinium_carterae.1